LASFVRVSMRTPSDLPEVDDDPLRSLGAGVGQSRADLGRVVEVELAAQANHAGGADFLHAEHRVPA